jgi:hypothetical protein
MAASSRKALGRRLGVLVAGAVVATSLTAASAVAATSAPIGMQATGPTRPGADASPDRRAGTPPPGFLLERGRFKPVAPPPGQEDILPLSTAPTDLNDRDQIVGAYDSVAADATRGFLLERGRFATVHVPEAKSTQVQGINNRGQISGGAGPLEARIGFVLDRGRFTTFTVPGAQVTFVYGINDQGQIVGFSAASLTATAVSGFLRDARGRFTAINRPGATVTVPFDLNNRGQIVGVAGTSDPPPSPPAADPAPMGRIA